jgi:endonuclease YncB( thermonuclease family)
MRNFILALIISPSIAFAWELPIVKVIDGDTISTVIKEMPPELQNYSIRVRGIDTPEKGGRAQCFNESAKSQVASIAVKRMALNVKTMTVTNCSHDKYGGRLVCDININGQDVAEKLIEHKLARPYNGGKKESWCK